MNRRFVQVFMQARRRLQVPFAIFLLISATAVFFIKDLRAAVPLFSTAAIIALAILAEFKTKVDALMAKQEDREWDDQIEAAPAIKKHTITHCHTTYRPEIWCLGITLLGQLPQITTMLRHFLQTPPMHMTWHIAVLDPRWRQLHSLNPAWKSILKSHLSYLRCFVDLHREHFEKYDWKLHIYFYQHKPSEFGILAGGDLFLGTSYWSENRVLMAGQNRFKRLRKDDGGESRDKIADFKGRFFAECEHVEVLGRDEVAVA